jgi:hypothetical protein
MHQKKVEERLNSIEHAVSCLRLSPATSPFPLRKELALSVVQNPKFTEISFSKFP